MDPRHTEFLRHISGALHDPITGRPQDKETAFTAAVAGLHQARAIHWSKIDLFDLDENPKKVATAGEAIGRDDYVLCEYTLPSEGELQINRWGSKTVDLAFWTISDTVITRLTFVECKLNATFTGESFGENSQIGQYLAFLKEQSISGVAVSMIVLTPQWNGDWYRRELRKSQSTFDRLQLSPRWTSWENLHSCTHERASRMV